MNDSFRTDVFVRCNPETIACACIYLAARQLQVSEFNFCFTKSDLKGLTYQYNRLKHAVYTHIRLFLKGSALFVI